ncbi:MAG: RDD family protein [Campylobacterales bacterium]|nr:RDD family protein [Campylobacterales bacterium]
MAKRERFRDIKQHKKQDAPKEEKNNNAHFLVKIKAFLTDSFILLMPIMYIVFYLIMDGREDFAIHKIEGWLYIIIPLILIQSIFFYISGQTPGYKAYGIKLIDASTKKKPSLGVILFRNLSAVLSFFSIFGWMLMFFRKDYKSLHDLLANTATVYER